MTNNTTSSQEVENGVRNAMELAGASLGTIESIVRNAAFIALKEAVEEEEGAAAHNDGFSDVSEILSALMTAGSLRRAFQICYESQGTGARALLWAIVYILRTRKRNPLLSEVEKTQRRRETCRALDDMMLLLQQKRHVQGLTCLGLEAAIQKLAEEANATTLSASSDWTSRNVLDSEQRRSETITKIIQAGGFTCERPLETLQGSDQATLDACLSWVQSVVTARPENVPREWTSLFIKQSLTMQALPTPAPAELVWERWTAVATTAAKALPRFPWWIAFREHYTSGSPIRPGPGAVIHYYMPEWLLRRVVEDLSLPDTLVQRTHALQEAIGPESAQEIMVRLWASVPIYTGDRMGEVWDTVVVPLAHLLVTSVRDRSVDESSPRMVEITREHRWGDILQALVAFSSFEPPDVPIEVLADWLPFLEALFQSLSHFPESTWRSHQNFASVVYGLTEVRQEAITYCDQPSDPVLSSVVERVLKHRDVILLLIKSMRGAFLVPGIENVWGWFRVWEEMILACHWAMDAVLFDGGKPCISRELEADADLLRAFFVPLPKAALLTKFQDIFAATLAKYEAEQSPLHWWQPTALESYVREWYRDHPCFAEHGILRDSDSDTDY